jgi:hypothetical protein
MAKKPKLQEITDVSQVKALGLTQLTKPIVVLKEEETIGNYHSETHILNIPIEKIPKEATHFMQSGGCLKSKVLQTEVYSVVFYGAGKPVHQRAYDILERLETRPAFVSGRESSE